MLTPQCCILHVTPIFVNWLKVLGFWMTDSWSLVQALHCDPKKNRKHTSVSLHNLQIFNLIIYNRCWTQHAARVHRGSITSWGLYSWKFNMQLLCCCKALRTVRDIRGAHADPCHWIQPHNRNGMVTENCLWTLTSTSYIWKTMADLNMAFICYKFGQFIGCWKKGICSL